MLHIINFNSPRLDTVIVPLLQIKQRRHQKSHSLAQGQQLGFQQLSPALSCMAKLWLGALWHSLVQITAIQSLQHGQKIFKLLKISLRLKHINLLSVPFSGFRVGILESIQKD